MSSISPVKICMNGLCGDTASFLWRRGWPMKSGGFANLCYACGIEYDSVRYCERFHLNESGWRECKFCAKPVHCGCVVSRLLHEYLDTGGISCIDCVRAQKTQSLKQTPNGFSQFSINWRPSILINRTEASTSSAEFGHRCSTNKDVGTSLKTILPLPSIFTNQSPLATIANNNNKQNIGSRLIIKPPSQQSLGFTVHPILNVAEKQRVQEKVSSFNQENKNKPRHMVPKTSKPNKGVVGSDNRVAKPPPEGRVRNHMLPRYWPRITDQELLQISGDLHSNCTITPLFEKVLSASDASRIGRLVLPKACAEAYFPPIDSSEGVPVTIRDVKGEEWTFQFRFWTNNNSRMYVLEGVTRCLQNMQMEAGDTVIFSRLDQEDKILIGFRKAPRSVKATTQPNAVNDLSTVCTASENSPIPLNMEHEESSKQNSAQPSVIQEQTMARNIGSKNKRLHINSEDAIELKFTWEEAQEYLQPPSLRRTVVVIGSCEFEEYDEPPVFGKKTIFKTNASRLQEQWVQCDSCSKWRNVSLDVLIPFKWTCSDNVSDPNRCSCSAAEDDRIRDLDKISRFGKESKKRKTTVNCITKEPQVGPTGLGEDTNEPTTRHPRHRPGCSCIVCIQPPSGKGKHKSDCICTVCSTVRRRFKTMMLTKKKRLLEKEKEKEMGTDSYTT
ncbi:B3 domain-containing transcription repressor VAL1-like [Rutidosis leptorrhynchoides]|uniref:B3 domain-containing transcription repressor VAL1-like n=1 Tax=Rutidosis leptorrhynchoides TaxID=125765 RepID=UPI003A996E4C